MKKVVFVTDSLYSGGAERVMSVLANVFTEHYDTIIVSKAHIIPFYPLKKTIKIIYPKTIVNYRLLFVTFWNRLNLYKDLLLILKRENPDVVITFCTLTNGVVILICKILKLKVIASEHLNYKANSDIFAFSFIKRFIYPFADILTVLTDRDKQEYYDKFLKYVVVMPNPLPLTPVETITSEFKNNTILAIGEVSRWKHKGFDKLLNIFAGISDKYFNWNLEIAGSGDPAYLNNLIKKLNLTGRVILLGEVHDIPALMQKAKIFALSSRWEGLPMVLIEAMSQGLPCVAFNCFTGPADIITNKLDGILVEDQNENEFSLELTRLIENPDLRLKLGFKAIETSKRYDSHDIFAKWQKIIDFNI